MSSPAYFDSFKNFASSRDDGVLVLRFHTDGGPLVFTGQTHQDLPPALEDISLDRDNKAMVLTGTGDFFMKEIDGPSLGEIFKPAAWDRLGLRRQVRPVERSRTITKRDLIRNDALPRIDVDPETFAVKADGVHATVPPAESISLSRLMFFS